MTFEKMILDLGNGIFSDGQLYVALSRVKSLDGLFLTHPIRQQYVRGSREVLSFAAQYNDDQLILSEIETGRNIFDAKRRGDYDAVALCLLQMAVERARQGKTSDAIYHIGSMLGTMISDEHLLGAINDVPVLGTDSITANMLNAVFSLYGQRYADGIAWADKVLQRQPTKEAMYVKARCLAMLGQYAQADALQVELSEMSDNKPEAKVLFAIATVNEHIGDPCLGFMQYLVKMYPGYTAAIVKLRAMMRRQGKQLQVQEPLAIVDAFNGEADDTQFAAMLDSSAIQELVGVIVKQVF